MSVNTPVSDINEIYTAYVLADKVWFDKDAQDQYNARVKKVTKLELEAAQGKAVIMAQEFLKWAKAKGYKTPIKKIWWTARSGSLSDAVGEEVDQTKNPTDVLVEFASGPAKGFLGLSAKSTKGSRDIGFKNPGIGTVDRDLNLKLAEYYDKELQKTIKKLGLPPVATTRKELIRRVPKVKLKTEERGSEIMQELRDILFKRMRIMKQKELKTYLLDSWMNADEILFPPYIKVTGHGSKPPFTAIAVDPIENEKMSALSMSDIELLEVGNESIGVVAGEKRIRIMKIRFKFESEKMASSMKLSGDPY